MMTIDQILEKRIEALRQETVFVVRTYEARIAELESLRKYLKAQVKEVNENAGIPVASESAAS